MKCAALLLMLTSLTLAQSPLYKTLDLGGGKELRYGILLPKDHDPARPTKVLLALPPGPQNEAMVKTGFDRYWGEYASARGFVVVSPIAPQGTMFFTGGEDAIPALLRHLRLTLTIEGNRFHLAGASNGGRSAFRVATRWPSEFRSLLVAPGYPPTDQDRGLLPRLTGMTVRMFAGGNDKKWVEESEVTLERLSALKIDATLTVFPDEGHVPPSLDGGRLMEEIAALHPKNADLSPIERELHAALDDFNDAAAKADEDRYFGRFAEDGVFLGTDGDERWTLEAFKAFGLPYFQRDSAWIFVPQRRHVEHTEDGLVAWFDEVVASHSYGMCRGTGVLRKIDGIWRLSQYNLTIPIPNDLADAFVKRIRSFEDGALDKALTVYVVRHAEKEKGNDPVLDASGIERAADLRKTLSDVPLTAVFASEYQRTKLTVAPLAELKKLPTSVVPARETGALITALRGLPEGAKALVCGHSNTVPEIVFALTGDRIEMTEQEYDDLFVVELRGGIGTVTRLHYGRPTSSKD